MAASVLRLYDGFADTSPQLRDEVRELQAQAPADRPRHRRRRAVRPRHRAGGARLPARAAACGPTAWSASRPGRRCSMRSHPTSSDHLATPYRLDDPELSEELVAAARYGALIEAAAAEAGLLPAVVAGLGSRQSRWGLALKPRGAEGTVDLAPRPFTRPWRDDAAAAGRPGLRPRAAADRLRRARVRARRRLAGPGRQHRAWLPDAEPRPGRCCAAAPCCTAAPCCAARSPPTTAAPTTCCTRSARASTSISTPPAATIHAMS